MPPLRELPLAPVILVFIDSIKVKFILAIYMPKAAWQAISLIQLNLSWVYKNYGLPFVYDLPYSPNTRRTRISV